MKTKNKMMQSSQLIGRYLEEINAFTVKSREQEAELARRIREGDKNALDTLVKANLKFVVSIAKGYQGQGLPLQDLICEGNLGLIKAAQRFDETRGFKFISYAVWWVRQAILQALADHTRVVRLPLNRINAILKLSHVTEALQRRFGREPSMEELAAKLGIRPENLADIMQLSAREVSLDHPAEDEEGDGLINFIQSEQEEAPDEIFNKESLQEEIEILLAKMDKRAAEILRRYFGLNGHSPESLETLGQQFNLTRERVRQIKERALQNLRQGSKSRALREYL